MRTVVVGGGEVTGQEEACLEGLGSMTPPWMGMPSWMHPHLEQAHERGAVGTIRLQGGGHEGRGLEVEDEGGARAPCGI